MFAHLVFPSLTQPKQRELLLCLPLMRFHSANVYWADARERSGVFTLKTAEKLQGDARQQTDTREGKIIKTPTPRSHF